MGVLNDKCKLCGSKQNLRTVGNNAICQSCAKNSSQGEKARKGKKQKGNWNKLITPTALNDFTGQEKIKSELKTMLAATERHGIPVQHCLFSGSFGLGKTTLATLFAEELGNWNIITADNLKGQENFPATDVVIIDEIHKTRDEEWLLGIMDRSNQIILGATTTAGTLSGPLRSRFISFVLEPYSVDELTTIIKSASKNLDYDCPDFIAEGVAKRSKQVARIALFLFKRVFDRITLATEEITPDTLEHWFGSMNIDPDGLDNADRAYLSALNYEKPVGLQNVSAVTGLDRVTIQESVEPYLLAKGYVLRTPRGRLLGDKQAVSIWG